MDTGLGVKDKQIVLFDGICNFCNSSVNFIIKNDPSNKFVFAPLQSQIGQELLKTYKIHKNFSKSLILIQKNKAYDRSTAVLKIAKEMKGIWPIFYYFIFLPKIFRDVIYQLVANTRYVFGSNRNICNLPYNDIKKRFL